MALKMSKLFSWITCVSRLGHDCMCSFYPVMIILIQGRRCYTFETSHCSRFQYQAVVIVARRALVFIVISAVRLNAVAMRCDAMRCSLMQCGAVRCSVVLWFGIALHCIALHCIALHCIVLHCFVLRCVVLRCVALLCIALHCIALRCMVGCCVSCVVNHVLCIKCGVVRRCRGGPYSDPIQ